MADISKEIKAWEGAVYGEDVRTAQVDLSNKLNKEVEAATKKVNDYDAAETGRVNAEKARVTAETKRQTDTNSAIQATGAATADMRVLYEQWKNTNVAELAEEIKGKRDNFTGVFADERPEATQGFWHKVFEIETDAPVYASINATILITDIFSVKNERANGILSLAIHFGDPPIPPTAGASSLTWLVKQNTEARKRFAVNAFSRNGRNVVELYGYNDRQWQGARATILEKTTGSRGQHLSFTGLANWRAETALRTLPNNGTIIHAADSEFLESKKDNLFGLFTDDRPTAATGYWHKLFEISTKAIDYTYINAIIAINDLNGIGRDRATGIMALGIYQEANGVFNPAYSVFRWMSRLNVMSNKRFAVNIKTGASGNIVEFYVYSRVQYHGVKASIIDMSARNASSALEFTGYEKWGTNEALIAIPAGGTVLECVEEGVL